MDTPVVKLFIYIHRISTAIIACIHRIGKSFAQTVGIEPTRRGFGDLTDTLSVTCILLLKFKIFKKTNKVPILLESHYEPVSLTSNSVVVLVVEFPYHILPKLNWTSHRYIFYMQLPSCPNYLYPP